MNLIDSILEFIKRDIDKFIAKPKSHKIILILAVLGLCARPYGLIVIPIIGLYGLYVILEDYFDRSDQ